MAGKMGLSKAGYAIVQQHRALEMQVTTKHLQHNVLQHAVFGNTSDHEAVTTQLKNQAPHNKSLHLTAGSLVTTTAFDGITQDEAVFRNPRLQVSSGVRRVCKAWYNQCKPVFRFFDQNWYIFLLIPIICSSTTTSIKER